MKAVNVFSFVLLAFPVLAQQTEAPTSKQPAVTLENNKTKPKKDSPFRLIQGTVKDQSDNPVAGAIVQLKNAKTSKLVDFATKDDGKFAFRDLPLADDYELFAKQGGITTPVKKVSIYDTRKEVVINFKIEPPAKQ
jgi:hypothetical protein